MKKQTPETMLTHGIRNLLRTFGIFHYKNHGGLGSAPGLPDITGIYKGVPLFLEIKTQKGRLSDHQIRFLKNINEAGGVGVVLRSLDEAIIFVKGLINGVEHSKLREQFKD